MASPDLDARFSIPDYVVFVLMLMVSAGIGFYYACSGSKQRTASEFLMANRSMGVLPIALSLLASYLSAIGLLGIPVEIYWYGTSYWCAVFSNFIVMPVSAYVYLPVFYHLQLTSAYEYLERRFNVTVRRLGSVIFILQMMLYMSMVCYVPALALSQVTGLHVWASVAAIGIVCTLYTTVGGMKAVMWTDVVQIMVMFAAMLAVIIQGLLLLGGFRNVLDIAGRGGRLDTFNFDTNPLVRSTFWNLILGGGVTWSAIYGVNQTQVQRYLTAPSLRTAQMALWWNLVGLFIAISTCTLVGLVLYAFYEHCDPLTAKIISAPDQLLPLFVMETLSKYPGLPGFFVAGIFSGSLSTLSSGLNSLAAVTLEDFIRPLCLKNLSDERAGLISKFIALAYGVLALGLVAIVEQLGNVLQLEHSQTNMTEFESTFGLIDYLIFALMLFLSSLIGVYYACTGGKQHTTAEFLLGNRQMTTFPIACSLFASFMSAVNLLSVPAEIYAFGTQYSVLVIAQTLLVPITSYLYLPVFYNLGVTSVNEYLEKRFNKTIRHCGAIGFILKMVLYLAVVIHAPALALSQATGMSVWSCVAAIITICTIYTVMGGIKGVMWTDVLQTCFMFTALIALLIMGFVHVGGFEQIIKANKNRFIFFNLNPHEQHTLWTQTIGGTVMWTAVFAVNQTQVQRYLSAKSLPVARRALWWTVLGLWVNMLITVILGLLLYTYFKSCDPLLSRKINNRDQLLPLYAMQMFRRLPGLPGLFVAGILSGSLSTLSSGLNSLSAITLEDFVLKKSCMKNVTNERASQIAKIIALGYGGLCLLCVLLVENFSSLAQAALSLFGLLGGPLLGLFTLGMFFPWANSLGSGIGAIIGLALSFWIGIGSILYKNHRPTLPLHCPNVTISNPPNSTSITHISPFSAFYNVSYMWYSPIVCFTVIVIGLTISFISGANKSKDVNPKLLSPVVRYFLKSNQETDNHIELELELQKK
uniref:Sodium-dependent multivitamin transporter n=1 Tax=Strigamia maritima TaxID=126957 RepID=T1IVP0_STRMM